MNSPSRFEGLEGIEGPEGIEGLEGMAGHCGHAQREFVAATFIALYRAPHTSLATDAAWLSADDWSACDSANELLLRLEHITLVREAERARALADARAEGHALGLRQGHEEALMADAPQLWQAWSDAAAAAQAEAQALREALVTLSLQVVQHITEELAPADVLAALARRASESLLPPRAAVVRVHPQLADAVRQKLHDSTSGAALEVRADPRLGWQDCEFDTPAGQLLAGLQAQLGRVGAAMNGASR